MSLGQEMEQALQSYPSAEELEAWIDDLWEDASQEMIEAELMKKTGFTMNLGLFHVGQEFRYVKFTRSNGEVFYGYWQPAPSTPAPLLVHVPGYGAEISSHPELAAAGFHVLHICPMGYVTPAGTDETKKKDGDWPVLPDTIASIPGAGYRQWLLHGMLATGWAMNRPDVLPDRVSFFGTSQGGGGALLLASMFKDKGARCVAADEPFLTNFPLAAGRGAYRRVPAGLQKLENPQTGWRELGFIDTLSHAERLSMPVLLTAGGKDEICPADTVQSLFERLPGTKSFTYLAKSKHRYTREFVMLAAAWFRLYA